MTLLKFTFNEMPWFSFYSKSKQNLQSHLILFPLKCLDLMTSDSYQKNVCICTPKSFEIN